MIFWVEPLGGVVCCPGQKKGPKRTVVVNGAVLKDQLGTLGGRYDEHNNKFFLSYETKV
jgi:hypothetical protein